MNMATRNEIVTVLQRLDISSGTAPDARRCELYIDMLSDIPGDILRQAAKAHIRSSKWYPKISELRELADNIQSANHEVAVSDRLISAYQCSPPGYIPLDKEGFKQWVADSLEEGVGVEAKDKYLAEYNDNQEYFRHQEEKFQSGDWHWDAGEFIWNDEVEEWHTF